MPHADILMINGWILTMDAQRRDYPEGFVAIRGPRIAAVGPMAEAASWRPKYWMHGAVSSCPAWSTSTPTPP